MFDANGGCDVVSVYTGCGDAIVRAYDVKSGTQKRQFGGHAESINSIAVSPSNDPKDFSHHQYS